MNDRFFHTIARTQFSLLLVMCLVFLAGAALAIGAALTWPGADWPAMMRLIHPAITSPPTVILFFLPLPLGVALICICHSSLRIIAAASATMYVVSVLITLAITFPINQRAQGVSPSPRSEPGKAAPVAVSQLPSEQADWQFANLLRAGFGSAAVLVLLPLVRRRTTAGRDNIRQN